MKPSQQVLMVAIVILLAIVLLVAVQNADVVELRFLGWSFTTGVVLLVLASAGIGALAGAAATLFFVARRRPKS